MLDRYRRSRRRSAKRSKIAISARFTTSGMHPYLGGQLSRFIWGNDAGKGAVEASNKLVASLQGHTAATSPRADLRCGSVRAKFLH